MLCIVTNNVDVVTDVISVIVIHTFEPVHEKTNNLGFRPGLT